MYIHPFFRAIPLTLCSLAMAQNCGTWVVRVPQGTGPISARAGVRGAYDSVNHEALICGGSPPGGPRYADSWGWNGTAWQLRSSSGPAVYQHAVAADSALGFVYSFAGADDHGGCTTSLFERWNGTQWTGLSGAGPSPRLEHSMIFDSGRHRLVLFGGAADCGGSQVNNETWEWDGQGWTLMSSSGPVARRSQMMAFDESRGVTVLFGGYNGASTKLGDTWEWNGIVWTQRSSAGPSPRMTGMMAYHEGLQRIFLFGGYASGTFSEHDTWTWDGTQWQTVQTATFPTARSGGALVYDPIRATMVLFGGGDQQYFGDTWEFVPCCSADFNSDGVVDFFDYLDFVDAFSSNDAAADFNGDGVIDFFDYLDFVDAFSIGC